MKTLLGNVPSMNWANYTKKFTRKSTKKYVWSVTTATMWKHCIHPNVIRSINIDLYDHCLLLVFELQQQNILTTPGNINWVTNQRLHVTDIRIRDSDCVCANCPFFNLSLQCNINVNMFISSNCSNQSKSTIILHSNLKAMWLNLFLTINYIIVESNGNHITNKKSKCKIKSTHCIILWVTWTTCNKRKNKEYYKEYLGVDNWCCNTYLNLVTIQSHY